MEDDLGRMRVLAGRFGCPQDLWSHLPPEIERSRLVEYCHSVLDELEKQGRHLEDHMMFIEEQAMVTSADVLPFRRS